MQWKRIIELWPYVLLFISLAGFVYLFAGAASAGTGGNGLPLGRLPVPTI